MGAGASTDSEGPHFSSKFLKGMVDDLRERDLSGTEEVIKRESEQQEKNAETFQQQRSERDNLMERLKHNERIVEQTTTSLNKEKDAFVSLMLSELPLKLFKQLSKTSPDLAKGGNVALFFPLVTVMSSNIAGFSDLWERLPPVDLVTVIDHLHAIIDDALSSPSIFIMNRESDVCTAVCGAESGGSSSSSMAPCQFKVCEQSSVHAQHAAILACAALKLMSCCSTIRISRLRGQCSSDEAYLQDHLQLRISLHSGPCSGGIVGLQQSAASTSHRVLKYRLFGPTLDCAHKLSTTGLALQIRVSEECRALLLKAGGFTLERCPDYTGIEGQPPVVSYWLLGRKGLDLPLPSLDLAIPLHRYDPIL